MPETLDSAGMPQLSEIPSLHTTPTSGPGSKTPPDPNKLGPTPASGDAGKAPKPAGAPGAPPSPLGGGGAGGVGGLPGAKPPVVEQKSPEEQLNEESIPTLRRDIEKVVKLDNAKDVDTIVDSLLEKGWKPDRLLDLIDYREMDNIEELLNDVISGKAEQDLKEKSEDNLDSNSPVEPPLPNTGKKPDNDMSGVNQIKENSNSNPKRSAIMTKQIKLKDGTLEVVEASDASKVIEGISSTRRRISSLIDDYNNALIRKAGLEALGPDGPDMDFGGGIDLPMDVPGKGPEDDLEGIVSKLKDAIQALVDWLGEGKDLKKDEDLPKKDFDDLEDEMDKGEKTLGGLKDKGPFAKKDDKPEEKEDKDEDENKEDKLSTANDESLTKKAGKGSQEAMDVTMGKKGPKGDKKVKDEKKASDNTEECESECEEKENEEKEASASDLLAKIQQRLAEINKEAQLYPFKDLNKQQVDNINATTAKDQISTIDSEIKGQPAKDKLDPAIHPDGLNTNLKAQKGKVSIEVAEKIRQHSIQNAVDKARLSVELAAQQQLKGLIENPLRKSIVAAFIEHGVDAKVAEDITYNAFIDSYENSQTLVMKEAFETFMEKELDDFVKVAQFVKDFREDKTSSDPVKEENIKSASDESAQDSREKTASVQGSPLRGTQVSRDRRDDYRKYWEDVARDRRGY